MGTILNFLLTFIGNIISIWILLEVLEKMFEVKMPMEKRRKYFGFIVVVSTLSSFLIGL